MRRDCSLSCSRLAARMYVSSEEALLGYMTIECAFPVRENADLSHIEMGFQERKNTVAEFGKHAGLDHLRAGRV